MQRPVLTGFTFAVFYMVGPIQTILNAMTMLSRASVAMDGWSGWARELAAAGHPEHQLPTGAAAEWNSLKLTG